MKKKLYVLLSILVICFIWGNSIVPGDVSGAQSSLISVPLTNLINSIFSSNIEVSLIGMLVRKLAHFIQFFALGIVLSITIFEYGFSNRKTYAMTWMIGLVVAILDEFIQIFIPLRGPSFIDVGIDLTGVILAALIIYQYRVKLNIDQEKDIISS